MAFLSAVQTNSSDDVAGNLAVAEQYIKQASRDGSVLVVLPECFAFMQRSRQQLLDTAEPFGVGPIQDSLTSLSAKYRIWIIAGSIPLQSDDQNKVANTLLVYDAEGSCVQRYDKIFLFDVTLANGESYRESDYTVYGNQLAVVHSPVGCIGLSICYDLRFPEMYRKLVSMGAQVLVVPSAFSSTTGRQHWLPLLQARAIENSCYVVAPAQTGVHNGKRKTWGHTVIIDPWGEVMSKLETGQGIVSAEIDLEKLNEIRAQLPSLQHTRPDLF